MVVTATPSRSAYVDLTETARESQIPAKPWCRNAAARPFRSLEGRLPTFEVHEQPNLGILGYGVALMTSGSHLGFCHLIGRSTSGNQNR